MQLQSPASIGPAVTTMARDIQPRGGHDHARGDLIAVRQQHQPVELVRLHHGLHGVGNQLARGQREVHPAMPHRQPVTHPRETEEETDAARGEDAALDVPLEIPHPDMPRDDIVPARGDRNEGPPEDALIQPRPIQQRPMRRPLRPLHDDIATHDTLPRLRRDS